MLEDSKGHTLEPREHRGKLLLPGEGGSPENKWGTSSIWGLTVAPLLSFGRDGLHPNPVSTLPEAGTTSPLP